MPTPAHEWHCDHSDEQEDGFQEEVCNDPRKEARKAKVMEYGIKSPSLSCGGRNSRARPGPKANMKLTRVLCGILTHWFRGCLEHHSHPRREWNGPACCPELS